MVIGPCVIKTRLSAACLGFGKAGTAAAGIPMLGAVGSHHPGRDPSQSPCTDGGLSRRDRGAKVLKKFCSAPTDTWMRREARGAGGCGLCLPSYKNLSCFYQVCALPFIFTPRVGAAWMQKSFAHFVHSVFDFSYLEKYLCIPSHPCCPTSKQNEHSLFLPHSPSFLHPSLVLGSCSV